MNIYQKAIKVRKVCENKKNVMDVITILNVLIQIYYGLVQLVRK